jgi:hypothetical protein
MRAVDLIIVARDERELLADLAEKFAASEVRVIADRRGAGRAARPGVDDRRRQHVEAELALFGFAFAEASPPAS